MIWLLNNISIQCRTSTEFILSEAERLSVTLDRVFSYIATDDKLSSRRHPERSRRIVGVSRTKDYQNKFIVNFFKLSILLLFFLPLASFSQTGDSTKLFPLNDPRNPNCPCHQHQKLADEEFKKLMNDQQNDVDEKQFLEIKETTITANAAGSSSKKYNSHKSKCKQHSKRYRLKNKMKRFTDWGFLKRWKDPTKCFNWR
jgi:hypothetical protein